MNELRQKLADIAKQLREKNKENMNDEELRAWNALKKEYDDLKVDIEQKEKEEKAKLERENFLKNEENYLEERQEDPTKPKLFTEVKSEYKRQFRTFGDQLKAIRRASVPGATPDNRLNVVNAEVISREQRASGMNEGIGSEGGFLLEPDFAGTIFETAVQTGDIMSRVDTMPVTGSGVKWIDVDESSVASSVYGGVIAYWAAEAGTVTASKPKLAKRTMDLEKLMGIAYATDELDEDAAFMSDWYRQSFGVAVNRSTEIAIVNGTGAGVPLGILNAPCLVTVSKESGQVADTVVFKNILKMWARMPGMKRKNAVWLINPDVETQLGQMTLTIGTGGVPVYLPAGGLSVDGYSTLFGRPVIPTDVCPALGDAGDVILCDLKDYMLIRKAGNDGGIKFDVSMHVQFLYGENTYRIVFRCNGMPKKSSALTIKNSSNERGSFITLAERA
jgi:HK97 family phage major capsid protein